MEKKIIEFTHPGRQANLSKDKRSNGVSHLLTDIQKGEGIRFWNFNKHKRKYIKIYGHYLANFNNEDFSTSPNEDFLFAWVEWEPQSYFQKLNPSDKRLYPNAVHFPVFSNKQVGERNTDPFIFGDKFYYTNCKQSNLKEDLAPGSVIVFGTEYQDGFALDTVFVVEDSASAQEYLANKNAFPDFLRQATLDHKNLYEHNSHLRIYSGVTYNEEQYKKSFKPFSFVPCAVGEKGREGVKRPMLNFYDFNFKSPGSRSVFAKVDGFQTENFWQKLVAEVLRQGYHLGIKFDMPRWLTENEEEDLLIPYFPQTDNLGLSSTKPNKEKGKDC